MSSNILIKLCKGSTRLTGGINSEGENIIKNLLNRKDEHRMVLVGRDLKGHINIQTSLLQVVYWECQLAPVLVIVSASEYLSEL